MECLTNLLWTQSMQLSEKPHQFFSCDLGIKCLPSLFILNVTKFKIKYQGKEM